MQKITPFLWFDDQLEEALRFYPSVFKNAQVLSVNGEDGPHAGGPVSSARFVLEGQEFMALNGGPHFTFSEATSFFVRCETQDEVDHFWEKLSAGGEKSRCGWLKDKFGLSWQIVPTVLIDLLNDPDEARSQRVMDAMLKMDKLDIEGLRRAADQQ